MKTEFKSSSTIKTGTLSVSNINTDLNSTSNLNAEFNSSSTLNATSNDINTNYLKIVIDNETGRYIEADTESRPDYVILKLFSAKGKLLDTTEFNVSGAASARVISCSFDLERKQLTITNSDFQKIVCDLSVLMDVIDDKVTKVPGKDLSTNDYTNTEKTKVQNAYTHSQTAHAPADAEKNVQANWSQTDITKDDYIKNKPILFTGDYNDLINKPELFSGDYIDLINKPNLFSGEYADLIGKPIIPTVDVNKEYVDTKLAEKQNLIDINSKLPYSLISNAPTNIGDFNNDIGYITNETNTLTNYYNKIDADARYVIQINGKQLSTEDFTTELKNTLNNLYADNYIKAVDINAETFVITFTKRDNTTTTIDLPLESFIVSGSYDAATHKLILTLQNSSIIEIPIGDIIEGLLASPLTNVGEAVDKTLTFGGTFKVTYIGADGTIAEKVMTLPSLPDIPTKTSQLENDSDFVTSIQIPTATSDLVNDSNYITAQDLPTQLSELNNDVGFITNIDIPTNLSAFNNDTNFIRLVDLPPIQEPLIDAGETQNIKTINNISILGSGNIQIETPDVNKNYVDTELAKKQNIINELNKLSYNYLTDTPSIPVNVSAFNNDSGYITSADIPDFKTINGELITGVGNIEIQAITDYIALSNKPIINNIELNGALSLTDLGIINFSGDYSDLINRPLNVSDFNNDAGFITTLDIPTNVSDFNNDSGYITITDIPYIPSKTSDLLNDTGFIDRYVSNLTNYLTSSEISNTYVAKISGKGLSTNDYSNDEKNKVTAAYEHSQLADSYYEPKNANIQAHIVDINNPHAVTKTQIGLGSVDDIQQASKIEFEALTEFINYQLVLIGNSFETKVPKTRQIIGIDLQDNITLTEFKSALGPATEAVSGLMSAQDKIKLNELQHIQSDWNQTDINALDYIKNKPDITDTSAINISNGTAESGKYISQIEIDASDNHKINITKELLPQGFSGDYDDLINTPNIPEISTDIAQDATSDIKTASPKAVKDYVDGLIQGLDIKDSVLVATNGPITLSGLSQEIDTIMLDSPGLRVLVRKQTDSKENGIYTVSSGPWQRASDANTWGKLISAFVFVEQGQYADTGWVCKADLDGSTIGTGDIEWTQFSGAGSYTDGNGISLTGNIFSINTSVTMDLTTAQSVSGSKTFNSSSLKVKGSSTGVTTIANANNTATNYTLTLPKKDGILAVTDDIHTRSHALTSTSDHTAGNWKMFYSNGSGQVVEIPLSSTSGYVLKSNGAAAAPSWEEISIPGFDLINDILEGSGNRYSPYSDRTEGALYVNDTKATPIGNKAPISDEYNLAFDGIFYATKFEGIIDGGDWEEP